MTTTNLSEISRQTLHFGAGGMVKNLYGYSKDLPFDGANNPNQLRRVVWDNDPSGEENFAQGEFLILNNIPFGSFCAHELENPGSYPALRQLENLDEIFNNLGHQLVLEGGCRGDRRNGAGALQVSAYTGYDNLVNSLIEPALDLMRHALQSRSSGDDELTRIPVYYKQFLAPGGSVGSGMSHCQAFLLRQEMRERGFEGMVVNLTLFLDVQDQVSNLLRARSNTFAFIQEHEELYTQNLPPVLIGTTLVERSPIYTYVNLVTNVDRNKNPYTEQQVMEMAAACNHFTTFGPIADHLHAYPFINNLDQAKYPFNNFAQGLRILSIPRNQMHQRAAINVALQLMKRHINPVVSIANPTTWGKKLARGFLNKVRLTDMYLLEDFQKDAENQAITWNVASMKNLPLDKMKRMMEEAHKQAATGWGIKLQGRVKQLVWRTEELFFEWMQSQLNDANVGVNGIAYLLHADPDGHFQGFLAFLHDIVEKKNRQLSQARTRLENGRKKFYQASVFTNIARKVTPGSRVKAYWEFKNSEATTDLQIATLEAQIKYLTAIIGMVNQTLDLTEKLKVDMKTMQARMGDDLEQSKLAFDQLPIYEEALVDVARSDKMFADYQDALIRQGSSGISWNISKHGIKLVLTSTEESNVPGTTLGSDDSCESIYEYLSEWCDFADALDIETLLMELERAPNSVIDNLIDASSVMVDIDEAAHYRQTSEGKMPPELKDVIVIGAPHGTERFFSQVKRSDVKIVALEDANHIVCLNTLFFINMQTLTKYQLCKKAYEKLGESSRVFPSPTTYIEMKDTAVTDWKVEMVEEAA